MNQNEQRNRHNTAEDKRTNRLCVLSVLLDGFAVMMQCLPRLFWSASGLFYTQLVSCLDAVSTLAGIAGLAVMIYIRIRYPSKSLRQHSDVAYNYFVCHGASFFGCYDYLLRQCPEFLFADKRWWQ